MGGSFSKGNTSRFANHRMSHPFPHQQYAHIDKSMIERSRELATMWEEGGKNAAANDLEGMKAHQIMYALVL